MVFVLIGKGIVLSGNEHEKSVATNLRIVEALAEFSTVLQAVPDADLLKLFHLTLNDIFPHIFCTMCDTWRRLKLPSSRGWVQLLGICFQSLDEAASTLQGLAEQDLECCNGDECTRIALFVTNNGRNLPLVQELMDLFGQTLYHLPASSVNVEKLHSNTQILCACHKAGRKPHTIQQNTYIMSCTMEHQKVKDELMTQLCGKSKRSLGQLLSGRRASHTMPSKPVTHFKPEGEFRQKTIASLALMFSFVTLFWLCKFV